MRKGQTKRVWTLEQKSEIVHKHLDEHISVRTLEKEYTANWSMICRWVKEYIAEGEAAFIPKGHPENLFAALHVSRNLSELERWRRMVAKLENENERLKKILGGRSWCEQGKCYRTWQEYEIIDILIAKYVYYYNNKRPAAALGYQSPVQYKTELGF